MSLVERIQRWDSSRKSVVRDQLVADGLRDSKAVERFIRWFDHGVFRGLWTNFHMVTPDVFRSNYPSGKRYPGFVQKGIKTLITLRGADESIEYLYEKKLCADHGIGLLAVKLDARAAPSVESMVQLIALMRLAQKPMLMHCKSGADRAGLASAVYLLVFEGASVKEAQKMLSRRFLHFKSSKTGVLDLLLEDYAAAQSANDVGFEDWLRQSYDPADLQKRFDAKRNG